MVQVEDRIFPDLAYQLYKIISVSILLEATRFLGLNSNMGSQNFNCQLQSKKILSKSTEKPRNYDR